MNNDTAMPTGKRFLSLFQVEQELPLSLEQAAGEDSDIVFLSWRARSADPRSIPGFGVGSELLGDRLSRHDASSLSTARRPDDRSRLVDRADLAEADDRGR